MRHGTSIVIEPALLPVLAQDEKLRRSVEYLRETLAHDLPRFRRCLKRLIAGDQLEYVLGEQVFDGHAYIADRRAYIAQEDSLWFLDLLTPACAELHARLGRALNLCEVGVGGGALLCALLYRLDERGVAVDQIVGCDIDGAALCVAQKNCAQHGQRVRLIESDVMADLPGDVWPDLIFAYPPWGDVLADKSEFLGTEWEIFHRALPQISCYTLDGETAVHEAIIGQVRERFNGAEVFIFNDVLPIEELQRITKIHQWIKCVPCGPKMTALVGRN